MEMTKNELFSQKFIDAVTNDMDFYKAFISAENPAALQKVLKDHGFEATIEEIEDCFKKGVNEILSNNANELSEDQLEDVAGGGAIRGTARLIVSCGAAYGYGCLCALYPPAFSGAKYVAGGLAIWTTAGYKKK